MSTAVATATGASPVITLIPGEFIKVFIESHLGGLYFSTTLPFMEF